MIAHRGFLAISLFYGFCIALLTLTVPLAVQALVNSLTFINLLQPLMVLSLILFILLTASGFLKILQFGVVDRLQRKLVSTLGRDIALQIPSRGDISREDLERRLTRILDVFGVQKNIATLTTEGFALILQIIVGLLLIAFYHPYFLVFDAVFVIALYFPLKLGLRRTTDTAMEKSTAKYGMLDWLQENGDIAPLLDTPQSDAPFHKAAEEILAEYDSHHRRHYRNLVAHVGYLAFFYAFGSAIFLLLGGMLVIRGELGLGQLIAAELVITTILAGIANSGKFFEDYYSLVAKAAKISYALDIAENFDASQIVESKKVYKTSASLKDTQIHKTVFLSLGAGFLVACTILVFAPWQQTTAGIGRVIALDPSERIQDMQSGVNGRLTRWYVQEGDLVKKGSPIVEIQDLDPDRISRLKEEITVLERKLEISRIAAETASRNFKRQDELMQQGLSSQKQFEKAKLEYKELKSRIATNEASLLKARTILSREGQRTVTAPTDGVILSVAAGGVGGIIVKAGTSVGTLLPETQNLSVEVFVDGNDLSLIYPGRKARIQFEGWPAVQMRGWPSAAVGTFGGLVHLVDTSQMKQGKYRVVIRPDPDDPEQWPSSNFLRQQMVAQAWIQLDEVPLGFEWWRQINGFPLAAVQNGSNLADDKQTK